jgi:hypothetical protein
MNESLDLRNRILKMRESNNVVLDQAKSEIKTPETSTEIPPQKTQNDVMSRGVNFEIKLEKENTSLENKKIEKFYFSIHAPYQIRENKDYNSELELKRIEIIKTFNDYLEKYTKEFNSKFVDTFSFTCDDKGESNKKYMIDPTHLSPEALPIIEQSINNL